MGGVPDQAAGPFFCFQGRDGGAFRTSEDAAGALGSGEVKKGLWRVFGADGTEFRLAVSGGWGNRHVVVTDEVVGTFADELRDKLRYMLGLVPAKDRRLSDAAIANASLADLGEELARIYAD